MTQGSGTARPGLPEIFGMSLAVWPSAFVLLAVAMWSASSTFRGRPNLVRWRERIAVQGRAP